MKNGDINQSELLSEATEMIQNMKNNPGIGNIKEMMSEYMTNQSCITLLGVVGLSVFYKIRIFLIDTEKKTHLEYTPEIYDKICYIYKNEKIKGNHMTRNSSSTG
jgi:hypothetical protein